MRNVTRWISATALALFVTGCAQPAPAPPPDTRDADAQTIKASEAAWSAAWGSKDLDKVAANYADDATVMAPGMDPMKGKDAIRAGLQEVFKDPAMSLTFKPERVEVAKSSDVAFSQGTYTMVMTDPMTKKPMTDHGSYVTTYRKTADGSWKAVSDIASSSVPSMPIPPAPAPKKK